MIYSCLGILLVIGSFIIYKTYAFYEEKKSFNVLKGRVPNFVENDISLAFTIDGQAKSISFPNKEDGYIVNQVKCNKGITARWDHSTWSLEEIQNVNNEKIKCQIDFKTVHSQGKLIDYIENLGNSNAMNLVYDGTSDNNLRYIGKDPNNYVWFNNELWRIIGVMNHVKDIYGDSKSRIKIIRATSIGIYDWDKKPAGVLGSNDRSNNDWNTSTLQDMLNNGAYYNRKQDFKSIGLTNEAKDMIDSVVWDVGGTPDYLTPLNYYIAERGNNVYEGNPTKWVGNVGLIYPSDYGFATSGGENTNRNMCMNTNMRLWSEVPECSENNWLLKPHNQRTLTSVSDNLHRGYVIGGAEGVIFQYDINSVDPTYPVAYLDSDLLLVDGDGTQNSPYRVKNN